LASVSRDQNGTKRVCFTDGTGKRHVIRLGRITVREAEETRLRVEALLAATMYRRSPDVELLGWLNGLDDCVHRRFANKGLVPLRERTAGPTLEGLIESFLDASTVKPTTLAAYKQTTDSLLEVPRPRTPLSEITAADAYRWRKAISEKGRPPQAARLGHDRHARPRGHVPLQPRAALEARPREPLRAPPRRAAVEPRPRLLRAPRGGATVHRRLPAPAA